MLGIGRNFIGLLGNGKKVESNSNCLRNDELTALDVPGVRFEFLETGLHRTPDKMPQAIQEKIFQVEELSSYVVLGYGLCGNGIVGIKAGKRPLIIPRTHD